MLCTLGSSSVTGYSTTARTRLDKAAGGETGSNANSEKALVSFFPYYFPIHFLLFGNFIIPDTERRSAVKFETDIIVDLVVQQEDSKS